MGKKTKVRAKQKVLKKIFVHSSATIKTTNKSAERCFLGFTYVVAFAGAGADIPLNWFSSELRIFL